MTLVKGSFRTIVIDVVTGDFDPSSACSCSVMWSRGAGITERRPVGTNPRRWYSRMTASLWSVTHHRAAGIADSQSTCLWRHPHRVDPSLLTIAVPTQDRQAHILAFL